MNWSPRPTRGTRRTLGRVWRSSRISWHCHGFSRHFSLLSLPITPVWTVSTVCIQFHANFKCSPESEVDPLLLSWDVLMRFFGDLDVLSRVRFCDAIDVKTLSNALAHLFNSLSDPPGHKGFPPSPAINYFLFASSDAICVVSNVDDLFTGPFHYKLVDRPFDREHFTSNLFFRTLATIPALFREWHGTLSKTEANTVNE